MGMLFFGIQFSYHRNRSKCFKLSQKKQLPKKAPLLAFSWHADHCKFKSLDVAASKYVQHRESKNVKESTLESESFNLLSSQLMDPL